MKYFAGIGLVLGMLALIIGCGGGGGGGTGSTTSTTSTTSGNTGLTNYQLTGVLQSNTNQMVDLQTLFVGDQVLLQVTAENAKGQLVTVPANGYTITAPSTVATVTSSGGLSAVGSSGSSSYLISVKVNGNQYQATLAVVQPQDVVTGVVQNSYNNGPVNECAVMFYNSGGTLLSTTYTTRQGSFRASVPASATQFTIDTTPGDPGNVYYYLQYSYGTKEYLDGPSCLAAMGVTASSTGPVALPNPVLPDLKILGPPPPPTGCIG